MPLALVHRRHLGAGVLAAGLSGGALLLPPAQAMQACFSDPIVYLSNGQQVDLSATIGDSAADVTGITYALYVPAHVSVRNVVYTGGAFAGKEKLVVYQAGTADARYTGLTTLQTATAGVTLTAQARVTGSLGTAQASASGQSGQTITLSVSQG